MPVNRKKKVESEVRKVKREVIEEMNNFVIRVLKGGSEVNLQETAILPEILHILETLPDNEIGRV